MRKTETMRHMIASQLGMVSLVLFIMFALVAIVLPIGYHTPITDTAWSVSILLSVVIAGIALIIDDEEW